MCLYECWVSISYSATLKRKTWANTREKHNHIFVLRLVEMVIQRTNKFFIHQASTVTVNSLSPKINSFSNACNNKFFNWTKHAFLIRYRICPREPFTGYLFLWNFSRPDPGSLVQILCLMDKAHLVPSSRMFNTTSPLTRKPQEENLRIFLNQKGFPLKFTQLPIHWYHDISRSPWILFHNGARIQGDF